MKLGEVVRVQNPLGGDFKSQLDRDEAAKAVRVQRQANRQMPGRGPVSGAKSGSDPQAGAFTPGSVQTKSYNNAFTKSFARPAGQGKGLDIMGNPLKAVQPTAPAAAAPTTSQPATPTTAAPVAPQPATTPYSQARALVSKLDKKGRQRIAALLSKELGIATPTAPATKPAAGAAGAFGQMANQLGNTRRTSTGGNMTATPTGVKHTANPNNPNAQVTEGTYTKLNALFEGILKG
jgi:hypothetical protein